jgi:hypothetical protein
VHESSCKVAPEAHRSPTSTGLHNPRRCNTSRFKLLQPRSSPTTGIYQGRSLRCSWSISRCRKVLLSVSVTMAWRNTDASLGRGTFLKSPRDSEFCEFRFNIQVCSSVVRVVGFARQRSIAKASYSDSHLMALVRFCLCEPRPLSCLSVDLYLTCVVCLASFSS